MATRPHVLLSCAISIDGYLDDLSAQRLILSSPADLDRVDGVRAEADAVLVGAGTVRRDDPRLLVRSAARRRDRVARGAPASPLRVILTATGDLDPDAQVFTTPEVATLVYCATPGVGIAHEHLAGRATVVDAGDPVELSTMLADLRGRGVRRLLVEGGATVHTAFLAAGLADELHLVVAPLVLGEAGAPRLTGAARFPPRGRAALVEVRRLEDVVLLRYVFDPSPRSVD
ncbi:MAG: RibD family protein [Kineosporiaceae bacterium]